MPMTAACQCRRCAPHILHLIYIWCQWFIRVCIIHVERNNNKKGEEEEERATTQSRSGDWATLLPELWLGNKRTRREQLEKQRTHIIKCMTALIVLFPVDFVGKAKAKAMRGESESRKKSQREKWLFGDDRFNECVAQQTGYVAEERKKRKNRKLRRRRNDTTQNSNFDCWIVAAEHRRVAVYCQMLLLSYYFNIPAAIVSASSILLPPLRRSECVWLLNDVCRCVHCVLRYLSLGWLDCEPFASVMFAPNGRGGDWWRQLGDIKR